jgi:hypothetical protein
MENKDFKLLQWQDVRDEVGLVNKELRDIIDAINPDKTYKLVKIKYSFGDLIIKEGQFFSSFMTEKTNTTIANKLKKYFSYSPIPLAFVLNKGCEVFVETNERASPLNVLTPGSLFGCFELMNFFINKPSTPIWNVSAGSRTIFMLPKLADNLKFKKLRLKYDIPSTLRLKYITDHWKIFKKIAASPELKKNWECEIIFFTEKWFQHKKDTAWLEWYRYLSKTAWQQSQYAIEKITFSLFWQAFTNAISSRNLKPRSYLVDTIKHLLLICSGASPAIIPANHKQTLFAPILQLQQAIVDIYQLRDYLPTIMYAASLNDLKKQLPVYYSLSYPTLVEGSPFNTSFSTVMLDLRDIKLLMDTLIYRVNIKDNFIKNLKFEYFHTGDDIYKEIKSSNKAQKEDSRLTDDLALFSDRKFCETSIFWRGAIKIDSIK